MKVSLSLSWLILHILLLQMTFSHCCHAAFAVSIYGVSADYIHYISPQHLKWGKNNQSSPVGLTQ